MGLLSAAIGSFRRAIELLPPDKQKEKLDANILLAASLIIGAVLLITLPRVVRTPGTDPRRMGWKGWIAGVRQVKSASCSPAAT